MSDTNLKLTTAGEILAAKIEAGDGTVPLYITRIVTASGTSPNPLGLTSVVDLQQEATITERGSVGNRAKVTAMLSNYGNPLAGIPPLEQGYELYQIGIYANDPDVGEVLYRISQFQNPNWVPPLSERPWELTLNFSFGVGNASEVIIEVNPSDFVTRAEVDNILLGFSQKPHASPIDEFGRADATNFGHSQLEDDPSASTDATGGRAATPRMVQGVANILNNRVDILDNKVNSLVQIQITGIVDTYADLLLVDPIPADGTLYLVRADENNDDQQAIYEVIGGAWVFFALFAVNLENYATIEMLNAAIQTALASIDLSDMAQKSVLGTLSDPPVSVVGDDNTAMAYLKGQTSGLFGIGGVADKLVALDVNIGGIDSILQALADGQLDVNIGVSVQRGIAVAQGHNTPIVSISEIEIAKSYGLMEYPSFFFSLGQFPDSTTFTSNVGGVSGRSYPWMVISYGIISTPSPTFYAQIENGIVVGVRFSPVKDSNPDAVEIPTLDQSLLNAACDRTNPANPIFTKVLYYDQLDSTGKVTNVLTLLETDPQPPNTILVSWPDTSHIGGKYVDGVYCPFDEVKELLDKIISLLTDTSSTILMR